MQRSITPKYSANLYIVFLTNSEARLHRADAAYFANRIKKYANAPDAMQSRFIYMDKSDFDAKTHQLVDPNHPKFLPLHEAGVNPKITVSAHGTAGTDTLKSDIKERFSVMNVSELINLIRKKAKVVQVSLEVCEGGANYNFSDSFAHRLCKVLKRSTDKALVRITASKKIIEVNGKGKKYVDLPTHENPIKDLIGELILTPIDLVVPSSLMAMMKSTIKFTLFGKNPNKITVSTTDTHNLRTLLQRF